MSNPATPDPVPTDPAISVTDVFCLHTVPDGTSVAALRGMSLRVERGERLVVHGPNGSGKTTLLRVLSGETAVSSGTVRVDRVDVAGAPPARLVSLRRATLGLVDQHSGRALRPELRVVDNVALQLRIGGAGRAAARQAAEQSLAALGLAGLAGRRPATLSAGEAQRVAVCAAVAHRPRVVLADEPTGELDVASADAVYDLLAEAAARAGASLLLVTHDQRAARIAERVVRIRDGRLSEQWAPASPGREELVVDDRGWLRLPDALRRRHGLLGVARVTDGAGGVLLTGSVGGTDPAAAGRPAASGIALGMLGAPPTTPRDTVAPLAECRAVTVRYGDRSVLDGFAAAIAPARLTVVRGRSGAGKSTLLRLLLGLVDPDHGEIRLGGVALAGLGRAARAALRHDLVGVSTQSGALAETLDIAENLSLARVARGLPADAALVADLAGALGLAALVRRPVRLLSGGERQRVAVARSLVVQRPLIVLDEPTSQQDETHAELLADVLAAAARAGAGVLCATHDEVLAAAADVVLEL